MKFPIRRKVLMLTAALSLALIGAAALISYSLFSARNRQEAMNNCQSAAKTMAAELEKSYVSFILLYQKRIDDAYQKRWQEIVAWSSPDADEFPKRSAFFDEITRGIFPPKDGVGLSYEMAILSNNYITVQMQMNLSAMSSGMTGGFIFYQDPVHDRLVYLADSTSPNSPGYHFPGSVELQDEKFRLHVLGQDNPKPFEDGRQFFGVSPVLAKDKDFGQTQRVYVGFYQLMDERGQASFIWSMIWTMLVTTAVLALVYLLFVDRVLVRNITKLSGAADGFTRQLQQGDALAPVRADIAARDEVGELSRQFDLMQDKMLEYVQTIGEKNAREESIKAELAIASRIQLESLPGGGFDAGAYHIDSFIRPAKEVGGDLYDYFMVDEDHLFFVVADVSGKGIPAALFMMRGQELIRAHAAAGKSPGEIAKTVNVELCKNNKEGLFITAFFGMAELSSRQLKFARAGHEQPFLIRKGEARQISEESNFVLGLFDHFDFEEGVLQLEPGDRIMVFTDGLDEGINPREEAFGYERIRRVLENTQGNTLPALYDALLTFAEGAEQFDDVTLLQLSVAPGEMRWEFQPPAYAHITQVCDGIHTLLQDAPPEQVARLCMVTDEVMNNCVSYAYEGVEAPWLAVTLSRLEGKVIMNFCDNGLPFNPLEADARAHVNRDILNRREGGMGIHFIKSFADMVHYAYEEGENRLTIEKKM